MTSARTRVRIEGVVQGVGFRPHVHRLATELGVDGFVRNDGGAVLIEAEGSAAVLAAFVERVADEAPTLARVERVVGEAVAPTGAPGFAIAPSAVGNASPAVVAADAATCDDCLRELLDPLDRRYRYAFTSCTACGPRYTITRSLPYDRARTTMASFAPCARCRAEHDDPRDRRFHHQANACPDCGPSLRLLDPTGRPAGGEPLATAAAVLRDGGIVAVKGIGGYHLACRADHSAAVAALRARKRRDDKPLAIMVAGIGAARALAEVDDAAERVLAGPERAIVLLARRREANVAAEVAPGCAELGVMLPYAPLHHLLLGEVGTPLVMTSGNLSDEPIAHRDDDALRRLASIADLFLAHDREIHARADDSVVRPSPARPHLLLRRSRGFVPAPLSLPVRAERPVLACGAQLKSTFCMARGAHAWVSQHIGDLGEWETRLSYEESIERLAQLLGMRPEIVAHDLHPDYASTRYALDRDATSHVAVQHHHAHLAACLAEHGEHGPAVGAIFDGAGYGTDGSVWGGELLVGDLRGFERAGHLRPISLPGGERAIREPWRMACAWLCEASGDEPPLPRTLRATVEPDRWRAVAQLALDRGSVPVTTSAGRLFDAVAALSGVRARSGYEGQAAMELEAAADPALAGAQACAYPLALTESDATLVLDARPAIAAVAHDAARGTSPAAISARFHAALAAATAEACLRIARARELATAVLSGGVFQNRLLLDLTADRLAAAGLRTLVPERLPPNDGGIAYGQVAVAAAQTGDVTPAAPAGR
jgi:hydrogenase maturation protein HypF